MVPYVNDNVILLRDFGLVSKELYKLRVLDKWCCVRHSVNPVWGIGRHGKSGLEVWQAVYPKFANTWLEKLKYLEPWGTHCLKLTFTEMYNGIGLSTPRGSGKIGLVVFIYDS
jgi:hypothetical protein